MDKYPKNLLKLSELVFILPDDFDGGLTDALELLLDYLKDKNEESITSVKGSAIQSLLSKENTSNSKVFMQYGIFQADDAGNYKLK